MGRLPDRTRLGQHSTFLERPTNITEIDMKRRYFNEDRMREQYGVNESLTVLEQIYFDTLNSDIDLIKDLQADGINEDTSDRAFLILHRIKGAAAVAHAYSILAFAHVACEAVIDKLYETADYNIGYLIEDMEIALKFKPK